MTDLRVWTAAEVENGAAPALAPVLRWSQEYLVSPHPDLGRTGPVCPYTQPSLRKNLFYLALPTVGDPATAVAALRSWHARLSASLSEGDRELLTLLLVLPEVDRADSTELDLLQRKAKDEFVADGLMIGQFHPTCPEPGLWNPDFRPLRSPVPLLAVRQMLVYDLLFLVDDHGHTDSYLRRFAPEIPARVRDQLTTRLVNGPYSEAMSA
ncbi:DUF6875 domain-containing protein [Actinokineospora sp. HUAS TT18]|uniref:DUF6875 domain-containing protein n=1 Tax=Actinokineospora sp. HUAS TT18 TaxID=3447451 RepID=UPI003F52363F